LVSRDLHTEIQSHNVSELKQTLYVYTLRSHFKDDGACKKWCCCSLGSRVSGAQESFGGTNWGASSCIGDDAAKAAEDRQVRRIPKLPLLKLSEHDEVRALHQMSERMMRSHEAQREQWAAVIISYITGKALQAYFTLGVEECEDYKKVKQAILLR